MYKKLRTLIAHTLVYGLGSSGTRAIGFFLIPLYTRYLTPADYGVLALVSMFDQILFIVMNMGQSSALFRTYFSHDDPTARQTVLTTSLWLILIATLPVGLLAMVLSQPLSVLLTGSSMYTYWVAIGVGGVAMKTIGRLPFAVLRAKEASRQYSWFSCARTGIGIVLAIVFVAGLRQGGRGVLMSQLVAELAMCVVLIPLTLKGLPLKYSRRDAGDLLGYGIYLMPSGLLNFILNLGDRYFLKHFGSLSSVGLYALGYRFAEIMRFVMQAFQLAWPQFLFANKKSADAPALYARVFTYTLAVMGLIWLVLAMFAKDIVSVMAAPAFREGYRVVPLIAGAFLFDALAVVGNVGMPMHKKVKFRPLILAIVAGLDIALNLALVPTWGAIGAATAIFVTFGLKCFLEMLVGYRLYPVPYEYGRVLRLSAVGAATYWVGTSIAWGSLAMSIGGKLFILLCAPVALYATSFFEPQELRGLRVSLSSVRRRWSTGLSEAGGRGAR
jgi:O-antigen/teichoic acid export membrane protein